MEYNTTRKKLILPEYGRNIQNMVDFALSIDNREERQQCAATIIKTMAAMNPEHKGAEDFEQTLWDHLMLMANYKLDIDTPYPINRQDKTVGQHPHLPYPDNKFSFRHYGATLEGMVHALADIPNEADKQEATAMVVAQMAKSLYQWNRTVLTPEKLIADMEDLSEGHIHLDMTNRQLSDIITSVSALMRSNGNKKKRR